MPNGQVYGVRFGDAMAMSSCVRWYREGLDQASCLLTTSSRGPGVSRLVIGGWGIAGPFVTSGLR